MTKAFFKIIDCITKKVQLQMIDDKGWHHFNHEFTIQELDEFIEQAKIIREALYVLHCKQ